MSVDIATAKIWIMEIQMDKEGIKRLVLTMDEKIKLRRSMLHTATKDIVDSLECALSVEPLSLHNIALIQTANRVLLGSTDGKQIISDPFVEIWASLVYGDGEDGIEYNYTMLLKSSDKGNLRTFKNINDFLESLLEPLVEHANILTEAKAIHKDLTKDAKPEPVKEDEASFLTFSANVIDELGEHTIQIKAFSKAEARDKLKKDYKAVMEITQIG